MKLPRLFSRSAPPVDTKESAVGHTLVMTPGQAVWSPRNYESFAKEAYCENVVAFQSINRVADAVASINWDVFRGEQELSAHPLIDLMKRPNPQQSGKEYVRALVSFYLIAGNSYAERVEVGGQTRELYQLRPDRMSIVPDQSGSPRAYVYTAGGKKVTFDADDKTIWHMKTFNPMNHWYGQSPIEAGAFAVDQSNQAMAWMQALLQNSARPSGALTVAPDKELDDESFNRLKAQIDEQYGGSANAGRPMLLEGGMDWKQMGLSPTDVGIIEAKFSAARDVALAFGVPPQLLGIPGDNTYSNYAEARLAFWEDTVIPLVDLITADWNMWLAEPQGVTIKPNLDDVPAIIEKRQTLWQMAEASTSLTINEKREAMGYQPIPGGDVLLVPSGMISLADASAPLDMGMGMDAVDQKALRIVAGYEN